MPLVGIGTVFKCPEGILGGVLEVAREGQTNIAVGCAESPHRGSSNTARAVGSDIDIILSIRCQACDGIGVGSSDDGSAGADSEAMESVLDIPRGGRTVLCPCDGELIAVETSQGDVGHRRTVGYFLDTDIVDEEVVGL